MQIKFTSTLKSSFALPKWISLLGRRLTAGSEAERERKPFDVVPLRYVVRKLDVGVAVTEARHVGHLPVCELQQRRSVLILHFHDVKDALHTLWGKTGRGDIFSM